jgi:DNA-binding NarL/FixJ family response regulator
MSVTEQVRTRKVRILLADDHPQVRRQLESRLRREPDFEVVGVATNTTQTWQAAQAKQPDLLLIDPMMRDGLGLATLRQVRVNLPNLIVVVLTAFIDTTLNIQLRRMGIKHILAKGVLFSQLLSELRAATSTSTHSPDG